jgi:hypothetical protein
MYHVRQSEPAVLPRTDCRKAADFLSLLTTLRVLLFTAGNRANSNFTLFSHNHKAVSCASISGEAFMNFHFRTASKEQLGIIYMLISDVTPTGLKEIEWWIDPDDYGQVDMPADEFITHLIKLHT